MTIEEFRELPKVERVSLLRMMFGGACPSHLVGLRDALVEENERTGWFPQKWTEADE